MKTLLDFFFHHFTVDRAVKTFRVLVILTLWGFTAYPLGVGPASFVVHMIFLVVLPLIVVVVAAAEFLVKWFISTLKKA